MSQKLTAKVRLCWESDEAKALGLGLLGWYTEVWVDIDLEQMRNKGIPVIVQEGENPDSEDWMEIESFLTRGGLPTGIPVCAQMGIPGIIHMLETDWEFEDYEDAP